MPNTSPSGITTLSLLPPSIQTRILTFIKAAPSISFLCTCRAVYEECANTLYRDVALHRNNAAGYLSRLPHPGYESVSFGDSHSRGGTDEGMSEHTVRWSSIEEVYMRGKEEEPSMPLLEMKPHLRKTVLRGSTVSLAVLDDEALLSLAETISSFWNVFHADPDDPSPAISASLFWRLSSLRLGPALLARVNVCPGLWADALRRLMEDLCSLLDLTVCMDFPPRLKMRLETVEVLVSHLPPKGWKIHLHNLSPDSMVRGRLKGELDVHVHMPYKEDAVRHEGISIVLYLTKLYKCDYWWNE
ncbi:hypothetical protein IAT38_005458 [Cryptococcus sp. DSM 104549]